MGLLEDIVDFQEEGFKVDGWVEVSVDSNTFAETKLTDQLISLRIQIQIKVMAHSFLGCSSYHLACLDSFGGLQDPACKDSCYNFDRGHTTEEAYDGLLSYDLGSFNEKGYCF